MALGFLTRDQIITQGLLQAGNMGLAAIPAGLTESPAVTFLKTLIHHLALVYDHPAFQKEANIVTGAGGLAYRVDLTLPTRYRAIRMLRLATLGVLDQEQVYADLWAELQRDLDYTPAPTGVPIKFAVKGDQSAIDVYPIPAKVYSGQIIYQSIPDVTAMTANVIPDFADSLALVDAVHRFARDCDKDSMFNVAEAFARERWSQYRASTEDIGRYKPISVKPGRGTYNYRSGD